MAQVKKTYPDSLAIYLEERVPHAIYCRIAKNESFKESGFGAIIQGMRKGVEGTNCSYADTDGVLFENLSSFTGNLFPLIQDDVGVVSGGSASFDKTQDKPLAIGGGDGLKKLIEYFDGSNLVLKKKLGVSVISLTRSSQIPKDYLLGTDAGWFVAVSKDDFAENWASLLKTIIDEKIKDRVGDLDYVDLRFGAKVFYKFR